MVVSPPAHSGVKVLAKVGFINSAISTGGNLWKHLGKADPAGGAGGMLSGSVLAGLNRHDVLRWCGVELSSTSSI